MPLMYITKAFANAFLSSLCSCYTQIICTWYVPVCDRTKTGRPTVGDEPIASFSLFLKKDIRIYEQYLKQLSKISILVVL